MATLAFYLTSALAVVAAGLALSRRNAAHALIYLIVALLAIALLFFLLGAAFAAALQVLIYAGAIMVLFVYVVMMLNLGAAGEARERGWLEAVAWRGPGMLAALLLAELLWLLGNSGLASSGEAVSAKAVALALFGPYVLAVEIASMLLLAALVGAWHLSRRYLERGGEDGA